MQVEWQRVEAALETMREMLQREANQGIRRREINDALAALAGMDALDRLTALLQSMVLRPSQPGRNGRHK